MQSRKTQGTWFKVYCTKVEKHYAEEKKKNTRERERERDNRL